MKAVILVNTTVYTTILYVVVLYEIPLKQSTTIISLDKSALKSDVAIDVLIYDNSKSDNSSEYTHLFSNLNITIIHNPSNPGVSAAYNYALLEMQSQHEWVVLLDQDTLLSIETVVEYSKAAMIAESENVYICAPVLLDSKSLLWSPSKQLLYRGVHINVETLKVGKFMQTQNNTILNSGLMVNRQIIPKIGSFNSDLFYYSDLEFFDRYTDQYKYFYVIPLTHVHDISSHGRDNFEDATKRYPLLLRDSITYSKLKSNPLPYFWIIIQGIKLTFVYKSIIFGSLITRSIPLFFRIFCKKNN